MRSSNIFYLSLLWLFNIKSGNLHQENVLAGTAVDNDDLRLCGRLQRHEVEQYLSTKTPYRAVANLDDKQLHYDGCHPTRLWSVIRHGTRNPSKSVIGAAKIRLMQLKHEILEQSRKNSDICKEKLLQLRNWQFNLTADDAKHLVEEGVDELIELAERIQKRFPDLLPDYYDPRIYYFKYTATQRTLKSAQSFATGLFGRHRLPEIIYPDALHRDPVLRKE